MKSLSFKKILFILFIITILIFSPLYIYAFSSPYVWTSPIGLSSEVSSNLSNNLDDNSNPLNLDCGSCILIEQSTGHILIIHMKN